MKLTYVIDGYNLLHAMGVLLGKVVGPHGLEKARQKLLTALAESFGEETGLLTVVFDAARTPRRSEPEQMIDGIHVLFAVGQEADDLVESLIAEHPHPKYLAVVSDDHRLQRAARRREARDMSCSDFLDVLDRLRSPKENVPLPEEPTEENRDSPLSRAETQHWLQQFGHLQADLDRHDRPVKLVKLPPSRPGPKKKPPEKP